MELKLCLVGVFLSCCPTDKVAGQNRKESGNDKQLRHCAGSGDNEVVFFIEINRWGFFAFPTSIRSFGRVGLKDVTNILKTVSGAGLGEKELCASQK